MANLGWDDKDYNGSSGLAPPTDTPSWMGGGKQVDVEQPAPTTNSTIIVNDEEYMQRVDDDTVTSRRGASMGRKLLISTIPLIFMGFFIFVAVFWAQPIAQRIFYGAHAAIPAAFLTHYWCCFSVRAIYLFAVGMAIWAIVIFTFVVIEFARGNYERLLDLITSALAIVSALYHILMTRCTLKAPKAQD